ncbi:transglycosylase domain-containing protein [Ruminococcaceae bacterium OttesenSCG-928-O06]|nr:transglycosylase domain-containing protein [Ruminococcaceae bacterium OttesenSCG-928-O06]
MNFKPPSKNAGDAQRPPARSAGKADERTRIQQALGSGGKGKNDKKSKGKSGGPEKPKGNVIKSVVVKTAILNVLKAAFVMLCVLAMIGSIAVVQVLQYVVEATENDEGLIDLANLQLAQTSYFMAYNPDNPNAREEGDYIEYQELIDDVDRVWTTYDQFPDDLVNAIVATEDREFWDHKGVNFRRTIGALINEVIDIGMVGGASTIDQQLVKNLTGEDMVISEDGDRTVGYKRKLREIFRALGMENNYSKETILEAYLNTFGLSERIAGVGAGARKYFDKEVSELTLAECATIAGITRAPTRYSPFQNPDNCLARRNTVLGFMYDEGYITAEERDAAQALPLGLADRSTSSSQSSSTVFSYFTDKAYNDVIRDMMAKWGIDRSTAVKRLYNDGLRIHLTVDLNVQAAVDNIMVHGYDEDGFFLDGERFPGYERALTITSPITNAAGQVVGYEDVKPQAAIIVMNYEGELIATSGGIGPKEASLSLNRGIGTVLHNADGSFTVQGTVRQTGSTMKPIAAYALGIDFGIINYSTMIMDAAIQPKNPYNPSIDPETGLVINDWPSNYGITRNERIPVVSAIAESTNTVACQVGMWVGVEYMFEFLVDTLQITSLVEPRDIDIAPLVLGSMTYGMSAYELAAAYAMFGGEDTYGVYTTPHSYTHVTNARGDVVLTPDIMPMQAISAQTGYVMNRLLSNVVRTGSYPGGASPTAGGRMPEGEMDAAGKTGTTSEDNDRWFVGLTPYYVTTVWWGYDQDHTLRGRWSAAARTNIPVNTWKALMEDVQADLEYKEFPAMPEGVRTETFCTSSGDLFQAGCPGGMTGYYTENSVPEPCRGHEGEALADPAA